MVRGMLEQGVIEPLKCPWASPVVLVKKRDGSYRFCENYRQLNNITKMDVFPLPRIDDTLDLLSKAKFFTTLDLASGYWQVKMHMESREKTGLCHMVWTLSICIHAVWIMQCPHHLSAVDGDSTDGSGTRQLHGLH